jgi:hypothetical protein
MAETALKWKSFKGLNTRQRPEELKPEELSIARNVDIDDAGRLTRRDGYDDISTLTGNYHSLWSDGSICLVVKGGNLYQVNTDWSETTLRINVGDSTMAYVSVNGTVYYTNGVVIGYIEDGTDKAFTDPGVTFKISPPPGQIIRHFNGRLYIAKGPVLWFTDAMAFGRVDTRTGFKQFPSDIRTIRPVDGGLFISDADETFFMSGPSPDKASLKTVGKAAITGSDLSIQGRLFSKEIQGSVAFFTTEDGICMGMSDGTVISMTSSTYKLPSAKRGAIFVREETDRLQLVTRLYN